MVEFENNLLQVKRKYFKNPLYLLYANTEIKGEVKTKLHGFAESPKVYHVTFYKQNDINFYLLLLFLMNLPETMA